MQASTPEKQPYQRPEIRRVNIVPDEMAAAGCKTQTAKKGPTGNGCFFGMCSTVGS
jgi:hypothetical protein